MDGAGIGKTRLAEGLADGARGAGQRVLWGRAVEEQGAPPLWPWRRILGAVGGADQTDRLAGERTSDSGRSDDLAAARFRAAAAAADALTAAAAAGDLLIVVEDLQWADHASLFLLTELAAGLPSSRLLVLATCRDTSGDPWRASLAGLARLPGLQVMRLAPLGEAAVGQIMQAAGVSAHSDLVRFVHGRSEGNPLYVATLARVLATQPGAGHDIDAVARVAGGSAEISHLVSSLSEGLDDGARGLLAAASVLGAEFGSGLAAAVCGTTGDVTAELSAAGARGLVARRPNRPDTWRFTHALVRDGICASLPDDERIALHGRAAAVLEPLAREAPERGGEVAAHLLRAAPDQAALRRAAGWAEAAAAAATSALAFEDAAGYLSTALAAAEAAGTADAERARLLIELATAEYRAGQLATSLQHSVAAADAAERDRAALAGQLAIARDRSEEAGLLARRLQDPSGAGLSYSFAVWLAVLRGDPAEIPADFFDVVGAAPPIPVVRAGLAMCLFASGRIDEAQAVYETLRQLPADGDRDVRNFGAFTQMLELIIAYRDTDTARACYDLLAPRAAEAGAAGTGLVVVYGSLDWLLGRLAGLLGRAEQALEHFARAEAVNARLGARPLVVLTRLDWAATLNGRAIGGDLAQARVLARQAAAEAHRLDMPGPAGRAGRLARELEQAMAAADPLTRREREIAGLVSDGLTNRAIADRLVLSERTVEGHVRSTLAKLQLTNRTELAAWALRDTGS